MRPILFAGILGASLLAGLTGCDGGSGSETPATTQDVPEAFSESIETFVDEPVSGQLRADDPNGLELGFELVDSAGNGAAVVSAAGAFTYTPNPSWEGQDKFTFRATNGAAHSSPAQVSVSVTRRLNFGEYGSPEALWFIRSFIEDTEERFRKSQFETEAEYAARVESSFDPSTMHYLRIAGTNAVYSNYDAETQTLNLQLGTNGCRTGDSGERCHPEQAIFVQNQSRDVITDWTIQHDFVIFTEDGGLSAGSVISFPLSPGKAQEIDGRYQLALAISFFPLSSYDSDTFLPHLIGTASFGHRTRAGWQYSYSYKGPQGTVRSAILFDKNTGEQLAVVADFD